MMVQNEILRYNQYKTVQNDIKHKIIIVFNYRNDMIIDNHELNTANDICTRRTPKIRPALFFETGLPACTRAVYTI